MAQEQTITGVRGLTSKTWYPRPPVEWGRAGGAVATIAVGTATAATFRLLFSKKYYYYYYS